MKITRAQVDELVNVYNSLPVKGTAALKVAKNLLKLEGQAKYLKEAKDKLINIHSDGSGNILQTDPTWKAFWADYTQLLAEEVDVEELNIIDQKELNLEKDVSPGVLYVLLHFNLLTTE